MRKTQPFSLFIAFGLLTIGLHAEELFLPPAGKDVFPATRATVRLQLNVLFLGPAAKGLGGETGLMEIDLSGPTVID